MLAFAKFIFLAHSEFQTSILNWVPEISLLGFSHNHFKLPLLRNESLDLSILQSTTLPHSPHLTPPSKKNKPFFSFQNMELPNQLPKSQSWKLFFPYNPTNPVCVDLQNLSPISLLSCISADNSCNSCNTFSHLDKCNSYLTILLFLF